jgi:hypothetical protein
MAIFQEIRLFWEDDEFIIPPDRVLGAVAEIEEIVTLPDLLLMMGGKMTMARLSRAYGVLLRYAGAKLSDEQVYGGLVKRGETFEQMQIACIALLGVMIPPASLREAPASGNVHRAPKARSKSWKRSSRRRWAAAG